MAEKSLIDVHQEWIGYVQPVGLVVSPAVLAHRGVLPDSNVMNIQEKLQDLLDDNGDGQPSIADVPTFLRELLSWEQGDLAGAVGGIDLPEELTVVLPEFGETLRPTYAVPVSAPADDGPPWQLLVGVELEATDLDLTPSDDGRGWNASPQMRFERLLRETGIATGLLTNRQSLRLVHAPRGETSGHATFAIQPMTEVAGRPILAALHMLLNINRLFGTREDSLPALLEESRKYQAAVSAKLAEQVLGALHELLRGLHAADTRAGTTRIHDFARQDPEQLYGGLLTALMRLVFVLYAEDRGLFPSDEVWVRHYSLSGLFVRLRDDETHYPDTMDERYSAWAQLLALWRLVHGGGRHGPKLNLVARRGRLFDPHRFLFLEGRDQPQDAPSLPRVADGTVWRMLQRLMVLDGERLSYRTLDVEQIGSVYETMMGFTVELTAGHSIAVSSSKRGGASAIVDLDALLAQPGSKREAWLRERSDRKLTAKVSKAVKIATSRTDLLSALAGTRDLAATPHELPPGTPVLQPTEERRRSGSHYTPRTLTEPIVRDALRPALERLGAAATPEQILQLKILDPAMGSGAFLVEACRQVAEELVDAWSRTGSTPVLASDEDAVLHARRLVAQRCLYGLDRNAMASDLGKLSLWLATLARDHEFTFLDHAMRHGDTLVGLMRRQIESLHWEAGLQLPLAAQLAREGMNKAESERRRIRTALEGLGEEALRPLLDRADRHLDDVRLVGDALVGAFFSADKPKAREAARTEVMEALEAAGTGWQARLEPMSRSLNGGSHPVHSFHWEIEFPEVFLRDNPGFDVVIGNPPFGGKNTLIRGNRAGYLDWLKAIHEGAHGNADLVAHFFRRAFSLLRDGGSFGLIATNTIRQGDTRGTGLRWIRKNGGSIYAARRRYRWPGAAAVVVSIVHVAKGGWPGPARLDDREVERITAFLVERGPDDDPRLLAANGGKSFQGSIVLGMGFTFDDTDIKGVASSVAEMHRLIDKDPRNAERIFPYIGGEEVNNHPRQEPHRWVINFEDFPLRREELGVLWSEADDEQRKQLLRSGIVPLDYPEPVAADWPDLLHIVEERVRPVRENDNREVRRHLWWRFAERAPALYEAIRPLNSMIGLSRVSPHLALAFLPTNVVTAESLVLVASESHSTFAVLQSRIHEVWARFFSSSLKDDLRYSPSDCFETFPFPLGAEHNSALGAAGHAYYSHRYNLMTPADIGLTPTYNRFNHPDETHSDILELRRLHRDMDRAVLAAYGWADLDPEPVFEREWEGDEEQKPGPWRLRWPEKTRDDVLARLIEVNARRATEEQLAGRKMKDRRRDARGEIGPSPLFAKETDA